MPSLGRAGRRTLGRLTCIQPTPRPLPPVPAAVAEVRAERTALGFNDGPVQAELLEQARQLPGGATPKMKAQQLEYQESLGEQTARSPLPHLRPPQPAPPPARQPCSRRRGRFSTPQFVLRAGPHALGLLGHGKFLEQVERAHAEALAKLRRQ